MTGAWWTRAPLVRGIIAFAGTVGFFLVAFSVSRQIAVAELTARPEVENWADPNKLSAAPFFSAGVSAAALFLLASLVVNWTIRRRDDAR